MFLAGLSNDPMAEYSPSKNFVFNAAAPAYLAYIAKIAKVKRFTYASSCSVYGYTENELYDESRPAASMYPYGISKLQGEQAAMQLIDDSFSVISLRKGTISGFSPRMRFDLIINTMFKSAMKNHVITVNNPSIWRPILSIEDAATAYIRAIEANYKISGIFNIASGNFTVGEIGDLVKSAIEKRLSTRLNLCIKHLEDFRNYKVSTEKAENVLSFHASGDVSSIVGGLIDKMDRYEGWDSPRYPTLRPFVRSKAGLGCMTWRRLAPDEDCGNWRYRSTRKRLVRAFATAGDEVYGMTHADIEISEIDSVARALRELKPQIVVNTAAMHHVENCEIAPEKAFAVNAVGARNLALITTEMDSVLMHLSTDYVHDGLKGSPYDEQDAPQPLNAYGNSKLAGEYFVRGIAEKYFVLRTSALYGASACRAKGGRNFIQLMLKLAKERGEVRVVDDEVVSPTSTLELARQLVALRRSDCYGLYHATAEGSCSWFELARTIFSLTNTKTNLRVAAADDFPTKVPRPKYSVLENRALKIQGLNRSDPGRTGFKPTLRMPASVWPRLPRKSDGAKRQIRHRDARA